MQKSSFQKVKLVVLLEMLRHDSDEANPLKTREIIRRLEEKSISCDRRTLARDIQALNEQGFEVMSVMCGHEKGYYIADRSFSVPELRILMDAVHSAGFITEKKTSELADKIASLAGSHQGEILKRNSVCVSTRKHSNESIYYTVNILDEAILHGRMVSFCYYDLNENHEKIYRRDKSRYMVEPVSLVFVGDKYYLLAISPDREGTSVYRIDRMELTALEGAEISKVAKQVRRKAKTTVNQSFKMFVGPSEEVTLRFEDAVLGSIYDHFGERTAIRRVDENRCECRVTVQVSPTFWGWMFQFGEKIEIIAPQHMKEEYIRRLNACLNIQTRGDKT